VNTDDKKDMEYALKHRMTNIDEAHAKRIDEEKAVETKRIQDRIAMIAEVNKARDQRCREVLADNPDRFVVSIGRKKVAPKKGLLGKERLKFHCMHCGAELDWIASQLMSMAEQVWGNTRRLPTEEPVIEDPFDQDQWGRSRGMADVIMCPSCAKSMEVRIILIPY
jgi:hypothetical protein